MGSERFLQGVEHDSLERVSIQANFLSRSDLSIYRLQLSLLPEGDGIRNCKGIV